MGRRSIEIKKIEERQKLNVTFTKRRTGLFSKAQEYSNRSGDQVAVIVFSKSGNLYTFGQPGGVDSVVDCYLQQHGGRAGGVGTSAATADVPIDDDDDYEEDTDDDVDGNGNGNGLNALLKAYEKLEAEAKMKGFSTSEILKNKKTVDDDDDDKLEAEAEKKGFGMRGILKNKKRVDNDYDDDGVNGLKPETKRSGTQDLLIKKRPFDINDNWVKVSTEEYIEMLKRKKMNCFR